MAKALPVLGGALATAVARANGALPVDERGGAAAAISGRRAETIVLGDVEQSHADWSIDYLGSPDIVFSTAAKQVNMTFTKSTERNYTVDIYQKGCETQAPSSALTYSSREGDAIADSTDMYLYVDIDLDRNIVGESSRSSSGVFTAISDELASIEICTRVTLWLGDVGVTYMDVEHSIDVNLDTTADFSVGGIVVRPVSAGAGFQRLGDNNMAVALEEDGSMTALFAYGVEGDAGELPALNIEVLREDCETAAGGDFVSVEDGPNGNATYREAVLGVNMTAVQNDPALFVPPDKAGGEARVKFCLRTSPADDGRELSDRPDTYIGTKVVIGLVDENGDGIYNDRDTAFAKVVSDTIVASGVETVSEHFSVALDYDIASCPCTPAGACDPDVVIGQSSVLYLCVCVSAPDVTVRRVGSLDFSQYGRVARSPITDGLADPLTHQYRIGDGTVVVSTRVLAARFFDSDRPGDLTASGTVVVGFGSSSSRGRELDDAGTHRRGLKPSPNGFETVFSLSSGAEQKEEEGTIEVASSRGSEASGGARCTAFASLALLASTLATLFVWHAF